MCPYRSPKAFENQESIALKDYKTKWIEKVFLGHVACFGYEHKISGKRRIIAALIQTLWGSFLLISLIVVSFWLLSHTAWPVNLKLSSTEVGIDQQSFSALILAIAAMFGAAFWREQKDMHEKWRYLADQFNRITEIKVDDPLSFCNEARRKEQLLVCLIIDCIVMGMWGHESFSATFKDVLEKATIYKYRGRLNDVETDLEKAANGSLSYDYVCETLYSYLCALKPANTDAIIDWAKNQ